MAYLGEASRRRLLRQSRGIAGWLSAGDAMLFDEIARLQMESKVTGDLLEIGVFEGRSAILLEALRDPGEALHVCDLFELSAAVVTNRLENAEQYAGLARETFESNFLRVHKDLPEIHPCPSTDLGDVLRPASFRLQHVDGSHVFEVVQEDVRLVARLAAEGGVVVFDDFRAPHTPGVAAAVWSAVTSGSVHPFCASPQKLYTCVSSDHAAEYRDGIRIVLERAGLGHETQTVAQAAFVRTWWPPMPMAQRVTRRVGRVRTAVGRLART